nr:PREDICTED: uncharacterized protein LOC104952379 [Notothenia coriiceps]
MKNKIIIDVDTGVDDAQAIMMALADPNVEVLGITCSHGNTPLENSCKNTLRVLKTCNRLDIPVYRGCAEPLLARRLHAGDFHGKDGLGDVPDPNAPGLELLQKKGAAQAIIKMVNEHPGEVTLVATAPLTNLAVAVSLNPNFTQKLKALYIMGGNTESRGNTTVCGECIVKFEWSFSQDLSAILVKQEEPDVGQRLDPQPHEGPPLTLSPAPPHRGSPWKHTEPSPDSVKPVAIKDEPKEIGQYLSLPSEWSDSREKGSRWLYDDGVVRVWYLCTDYRVVVSVASRLPHGGRGLFWRSEESSFSGETGQEHVSVRIKQSGGGRGTRSDASPTSTKETVVFHFRKQSRDMRDSR